ncbi:UNVERIFIED_CONTAM: 40S ribosomal protein S5 [Sesamum indicum]
MPHTAGRYQAKRFRKAQCPIVERLTNSLMMHGRNNGKKLMAVRIVKHAMEIIHLFTDLSPIQVIVDAVINTESTRSSDKKQPSVAEAQTPPPSTKSFAEALANPSLHRTRVSTAADLHKYFLANSTPANVGKQATLEGRQTLIFSDTETLSFVAAYRFALVGKFSYGAPQYRNLHRLVAGLGIHGAFTVSMINAKHVLISMSNETDFSRLWLRRIWYIQGYPMRVFKWTPTFTPAQESSVVPIWVSFPELPAHLFHKDALYAVASMIGTPLQIDDFTFNQSKLSKARVCIEIDLLTPLIQKFDIQINGISIVQKVEYEQVPECCTLCKHVGHQDLECYSKGNNPKPAPRR